jgi:hypothetical protein
VKSSVEKDFSRKDRLLYFFDLSKSPNLNGVVHVLIQLASSLDSTIDG